VTSGTATVLLLTDPDSGVGGMVQRTREAGVVLGGPGERRTLTMRMFSREADVRVGDRVVTSGLGMMFPKGLFIGRVDGVRSAEHGLVLEAIVTPSVDFGRLEEVVVLCGVERAPVDSWWQDVPSAPRPPVPGLPHHSIAPY